MAKAKHAAKKGAKKVGVKKKGAKKTPAAKPKKMATAALGLQPCLSLAKSSFIVAGCLPSGTHGPDDTLEDTGLITENLRLIFRECVFNGVQKEGCEIDRSEIPSDADTEIGDVIEAISNAQ